jgi:alpha-1,2-mannosyltransferase
MVIAPPRPSHPSRPSRPLRPSREVLRRWTPAALSAGAALGLALYLAFRNYQVDIDVYRMGARHVFSPDLYTVRFGNSGLLFTYTPFAALVFALLTPHLGLWALQGVWAVVNVAALGALIRLSLRLVVPGLRRTEALRWTLLLLLPALALNPVFTTVGLGQINLVLCVLVMWDLATERRVGSRTVPLGLATGLAAAIKLTPLVFVPYLVVTRRAKGARTAVLTFLTCQAIAFLVTPGDSWTYWSKDVFDSKRAGALLYTSDQNLSSVVQRIHHGPVSAWVLVPALLAVALGGLALAAWAHRRSSVTLGLLVCATTGLVISPITWVHHLVWVVPVIVWLAAGADRPRRGPLLAGLTTVLFVVAPIWWVPASWRVSNDPPELHQNHWQLLLGNSFFFAMLAFLAGVAVMLVRRSGAPGRTRATEEDVRLQARSGFPVTAGPAEADRAAGTLEPVGSARARGPSPRPDRPDGFASPEPVGAYARRPRK